MTSQIPGFYRLSLSDRRRLVSEWYQGGDGDASQSFLPELDLATADLMVENVIGRFSLPISVATNFLINGKDYLIPMVVEESSVVAAVSHAAKMFRAGEGFRTSSDESLMIGQIQCLDLTDLNDASARIQHHRATLLESADRYAGSLPDRGGGAREITTRPYPETSAGPMLIVEILMDTRDAMGANAVNTVVEGLADDVVSLIGGRANLRILSNLSDKRKARAQGRVPLAMLATADYPLEEARSAFIEAAVFAENDPWRAATHNKGIMNGIDAVAIATGNDWRAIEAGAHAYAARDGQYRSLSKWWVSQDGDLCGELEIPMAVGIVGGATRVHPTVKAALRILKVESARELAEIIVAVGLAQNFAALRALTTQGIQSGHMRMHARQIALAAGAPPELVAGIAQQMIVERDIRLERAKVLIQESFNEA
jgi:hydroxymethylglutaryl-CoA reductase